MAKVTLDMETFKALASPTRLNVLRALDERRKTLTELSTELDLNKATVHEHMAVLVAAGLADKQDEGRKWIYYALTWQGKKLLHPEENTTFMVLLGVGIASAGGGVMLLGKALNLWWNEHQPAPSGAEFVAANEPSGNATATEEMGDVSHEEPVEDAPPETPEETPEESPEESNSEGSTPEGSNPEAPESSGAETVDQSEAEMAGRGVMAEDAAEESQQADLFFDDPDSWLGIVLMLTAMLMATLAMLLKRRK